MNPDFSNNERAMLEAKLTALLLGELHADEIAALSKAMEKDPELAALYERLKVTIELVREGAVNPAGQAGGQSAPLKLSAERREKLLASFKTVTPKEFARPRRTMEWLAPWAAAAVIAVFFASIAIPNFSKSRETARKNTIVNNLRLLDGAKQQWALEKNKPGDAMPTMADLGPYLGRGEGTAAVSSIAGETYVLGKVSEAPKVEASFSQAKKLFGPQVAARGEVREGKVLVSPLSEPTSLGGDLGGTPTGGEPQMLASAPQLQVALKPAAAPAAPTTPAPIVLPGEKNGDAGAAVMTVTSGQDSGIGHMNNAATSDITPNFTIETYNKLGSTNVGIDTEKLRAAAETGQVAFNFTNDAGGKVPFQGDLPRVGRLFKAEPQLAGQNGDFKTAVTRDDISGLRYMATNAVVASQPLAWDSSDGATTAVETRSPGLPAHVAGIIPAENKKTEIVLPPASDGLLTAGLRDEAVQNAAPIPMTAGGEGFGGGGGGGGRIGSLSSMPNARRAVGGKQVELAAAAKPPGQMPAESKMTSTAELADANSTGDRALGFGWYLGNRLMSNGAVENVRGTTPTPEAMQKIKSSREESIQTGQLVQDGNKIAPYFAAKESLDEAKRWRQVLAMKTGQEVVDVNLPRGQTVSIVDEAPVAAPGKSGLGEKIKQTLTGKVERTARIQVNQEHPDIAGVAGASVAQGYDPYFLQTEFETIKSDAVLTNVVAMLKLDGGDQSKTEQAVKQLRNSLDLGVERNSKVIEIGATSKKPEEAARIANAVAEAYKDYRAEQYDELKNHGIKSLREQLVEQDKKIQVVQAKVEELRTKLGVSDLVTNNADTALPKPTVPPPTPQPEVLTRENAFSTFSLNVSDVSFKLAGASLEKGQMPEPASIRSEEFINAFDYRDPEARDGAAIALASERARYPFAQNRELLRFSLKTAAAGRQAGRPLNIVLLLDNSGSMERADRVRIIQEALRVLAGQLQASDTFSIVTFARTARLRVDGIPGNQAVAAAAEIAKLTPEGGTNLGDALDLAYETALHHYLANGDNRVVLLTDGAANLGDVSPDVLKQKVEAHRKQGVALDCFGIGWEGYNDDLLEVLTRNGDGRYGFINTPEEANTEFVAQIAGALHVAASDVKVQVEFNPKRVTSYRQIGYAKHQLTKEQFRDNTVDAAEIAAQEAGNALYTIETDPQGEGSIATVRVRYKVPGTAEYREQAWDVPYTGGAVALDQASPAMRLAATASAFSEWLATSPFAAEVSTDQLLRYLSGVPQVYGADGRPAKLEWMIHQARSISGK